MPVVYIDILFAENFIIDFLLIYCSCKIYGSFSGKLRMCISSLIAALYSVAAVICPEILSNPIAGFAVSLPIVYLSFMPQSRQGFYKSLACFYAVCFAFSGFINLLIYMTDFARIFGGIFFDGAIYLPVSTFKVLIFAGFCAFAVLKITVVLKRTFLQSDSFRRVCIKCGDKTVAADGFIDTGNMLFEPSSQMPVTVMDKELITKLFDVRLCSFIVSKDIASIYEFYSHMKWYIIPYGTVSGKGFMLAFCPDYITFYDKSKNETAATGLIGISDKSLMADGYKFIINPNSLKKG